MGKKTWFAISMSVLLACGTLLTGCDYLKATFDRKGYLEEKAKPLVTKYLRQENYGDVECLKVKITGIGKKI